MVSLRRVVALGMVCLTILLVGATVALSANISDLRGQAVINLGSRHLGASEDFQEFNPGLGLGAFLPVFEGRAVAAGEIGFYRNSLDRISVYATGSLDTAILAAQRTELRIGLFGGLANYPDDAEKFGDTGVPTIGSVVVVGGAQATLRFDDRVDFRVRVVPAGNVADAILTGQIAIRF